MSTPRIIRLRRPAVLAVEPGRLVPAGISLDAIDEAWDLAASRNHRLFDGDLLHVRGVSRNGHGGVTIHAIESSYRFHAVRAAGLETGVRPLGVKSITTRGAKVLMGRRSAEVHAEAGRWEFVPGGTLEPGVEPEAQLARELAEECGWRCDAPPRQIALLFDDEARTWEIVHRVEASPAPPGPSIGGDAPCWEYDEIAELRPEGLDLLPLSRAATLMLPLLREMSAEPEAGR